MLEVLSKVLQVALVTMFVFVVARKVAKYTSENLSEKECDVYATYDFIFQHAYLYYTRTINTIL